MPELVASLVDFVDPAVKRNSEDSDPCLGGQTRGWVADAAPAQRVGDRRGKRCELDQLALSRLCVRSNDGLALPGVFAALLGESGSGLEGRGDRVDWGYGIPAGLLIPDAAAYACGR